MLERLVHRSCQAGADTRRLPDDGDPPYMGRISGKSVVVDGFKIAGAKFDLTFKK